MRVDTRIGKRYATDLTDLQWAEIEGLLDPPRDPSRGGRPQEHLRRRIADAVLYQLRTGVQWHLLPRRSSTLDGTVWKQFCCWRDSGVWHLIMARLLRRCRGEAGRDPEPSVALLDAHSVPPATSGPVKRSASTAANASAAGNDTCSATSTASRSRSASAAPNRTTRAAGWTLLETVTPQLTRLTKVFADAAYTGLLRRAGAELDVTIDIRRRPAGTHWFVPTPAAVARRADLRLARPQPPAPPRLRSHCDLVPDIRPRRRRGVHAEPGYTRPDNPFPLVRGPSQT